MVTPTQTEPSGGSRQAETPAGAGRMVVVGNLKVGCGKSTVAFNLGVWLAAQGRRATLVDLDPQRTLTDVVAVRCEIGGSPPIERPLDALPAESRRLVLVDSGAADLTRCEKALELGDLFLSPVLPSQADIWAIQRYLKILLARRKPGARIAMFINRAEPLEASRETRESLVALKAMAAMCEGATVLPAMLGRRIAFGRSLSEGQGVFEMKGQIKAAEEFVEFARAVTALL